MIRVIHSPVTVDLQSTQRVGDGRMYNKRAHGENRSKPLRYGMVRYGTGCYELELTLTTPHWEAVADV